MDTESPETGLLFGALGSMPVDAGGERKASGAERLGDGMSADRTKAAGSDIQDSAAVPMLSRTVSMGSSEEEWSWLRTGKSPLAGSVSNPRPSRDGGLYPGMSEKAEARGNWEECPGIK